MTYAFLGALFLVTSAFITLAFLNRKDGRELIAARDMLDKEREETRKVRGELAVETAAHAVTSDELRKEKILRAGAEAQRNEAYRTARDHFVERIKKAKVADANHLIADLLSMPLPGVLVSGVPKAVPEGRATAPGPDSLIDPFAVQPPPDP
jgi:hypothetical protein